MIVVRSWGGCSNWVAAVVKCVVPMQAYLARSIPLLPLGIKGSKVGAQNDSDATTCAGTPSGYLHRYCWTRQVSAKSYSPALCCCNASVGAT